MAFVNAEVVKRSNVLRNHGGDLEYTEGRVFPDFKSAFTNTWELFMFFTVLSNPMLAHTSFVKKNLPSPGQGPSEKQMTQGYLKVTSVGIGSKGSEVSSCVFFPRDPGYRDTARMLMESAILLGFDEEVIAGQGGVLTTSAAFGPDKLFASLKEGGTEYVEGSK
jgi:short subunit dehydrogenase-like uncharacterized protein